MPDELPIQRRMIDRALRCGQLADPPPCLRTCQCAACSKDRNLREQAARRADHGSGYDRREWFDLYVRGVRKRPTA